MSDAQREPSFKWNGRPVFRCRGVVAGRPCSYERVENLAAVLKHEASHAETAIVRQSPILGTDGQPLTVTEGDVADFGAGAPVVLHGSEAVVVPAPGEGKKQSRRRRK